MKQSLSKLADIIMNLIVNTKLGKIPWEKSFDGSALKYTISSNTILIERTTYTNGTAIIISFYDMGELYAETNSLEMQPFINNAVSEFINMYQIAEQQANGLDDEKLNMLSELLPSVDTSALKIS